MRRALRLTVFALPFLAAAAWGSSYRWSVAGSFALRGHDCFAAVARGDAVFHTADAPLTTPAAPRSGVHDARERAADGAWVDREYGPLSRALGFRWATKRVPYFLPYETPDPPPSPSHLTMRFLVVPLWAVVLALSVPAWFARPRRDARGRGFAVEPAGPTGKAP